MMGEKELGSIVLPEVDDSDGGCRHLGSEQIVKRSPSRSLSTSFVTRRNCYLRA